MFRYIGGKNCFRSFLDYLIHRIKGDSYAIDSNIPLGYLLRLSFRRLCMLIRGMWLFRKKVFVARSAVLVCKSKMKVSAGVSIDRRVYVDALSVDGITLGNNVSIGKYTAIECTGSLQNIGKGLRVGNNVGLGTHGFFGCAGGIEIGDDTIFGNYVSLHSENHNYDKLDVPIRKQGVNRKGIKIGRDCWIGAKVTILDGAEIGNGCIVAAGAVVRGSFPDNCVLGGVPAKIIKYRQ